MLGIPYQAAIDMWSFGCILYELYVGYPLFPGEDEKDHMALMMEIKGIPPRSVLARSSRRKVFFDDDYNPIITPNSITVEILSDINIKSGDSLISHLVETEDLRSLYDLINSPIKI